MHPLRPMLKTHTTTTRSKTSRARGAAISLALLNFLTFATAACDQNPPDERILHGHGPLVSEYDAITACETAIYRGAETSLYSNRPYHTAEPVPAVQGMGFCRGARHGTNVWILEVTRTTTLTAFGTRAFGMERRGWTLGSASVLVAAAGVSFDRVYTRRIGPGRFVIRQGFTRSAPIVFWDTEAARISAASPRSTGSAR
ncbi:MAG: hypothetical protein JRE13_05310 [Deltaproteobacteria bacterium]|nr:hypothetical protein [Deltaproteobacteria bacterium]